MTRDLYGYGNQYSDVRWPGEARLAVSLVLNVEEGAELAVSAGDERNETVHEAVQMVDGAPDLCMESHFEYGARVGYWRVCETVDAFGMPLTLNACARALEATPWIGADAARRGYEIQCHGYRDDAPYYVAVDGKAHLVLPYAFDTNDMRFFNAAPFVSSRDFADYCIEAFERLWTEGGYAPKMLSIGLHTRIIGRPARIVGLVSLLRRMQHKGKVWFARREDIARHWLEKLPPLRLAPL